MPDWTYHPLRRPAAALLGVRRSRRLALRTLATVAALPGGGQLVAWVLGHRHPPAALAGSVAGVPVGVRLGAVVPPDAAGDAVRALPLLGAGLIEVAPVGAADVETVRRAVAGRRVPVLVRPRERDAPDVATALTPYVDGIVTGDDPRLVRVTSASVRPAADLLAEGAVAEPAAVVLAMPSALVAAGPGWFARVIEAATPTRPPLPVTGVGADPRRWPQWWWGLLVGVAMAGAGLAATAVTLGPVLLWYDQDFLGMRTHHLHAVNSRLVSFLRHDRITLAGTMVTIGVLYVGLSFGGMRRGWSWAREAYLASGLIGFPTLLYFLGFGFLEPLHTALTVVLFPMFVAATRRRPLAPRPAAPPEGPEPEGPESVRRRALAGQLLLIIVGVGLFVGGAVVSIVGLTGVFVASDLDYLRTGPDALHAANPRLLPFVAHDRAGFGGALMSAGTAVTLLTAWGWRRGESWVWWSLAVAAVAGFLPALAVHLTIGYTHFWHLAPVYAGVALTGFALFLARPYLCARPGASPCQADRLCAPPGPARCARAGPPHPGRAGEPERLP